MTKRRTGNEAGQCDVLKERQKIKQAHPGLARNFDEFLASFAKFREVERQFKGKDNKSTQPQPGARLRT